MLVRCSDPSLLELQLQNKQSGLVIISPNHTGSSVGLLSECEVWVYKSDLDHTHPARAWSTL